MSALTDVAMLFASLVVDVAHLDEMTGPECRDCGASVRFRFVRRRGSRWLFRCAYCGARRLVRRHPWRSIPVRVQTAARAGWSALLARP